MKYNSSHYSELTRIRFPEEKPEIGRQKSIPLPTSHRGIFWLQLHAQFHPQKSTGQWRRALRHGAVRGHGRIRHNEPLLRAANAIRLAVKRDKFNLIPREIDPRLDEFPVLIRQGAAELRGGMQRGDGGEARGHTAEVHFERGGHLDGETRRNVPVNADSRRGAEESANVDTRRAG